MGYLPWILFGQAERVSDSVDQQISRPTNLNTSLNSIQFNWEIGEMTATEVYLSHIPVALNQSQGNLD